MARQMSKLNLKLNKHIIVLLKLLKVKSGSLTDICNAIGESNTTGSFYSMKVGLMELGILVPDGLIVARKGRGEGELINYRIDKEALRQILYGDLDTRLLFEDARDMLNNNIMIPNYEKRNLKKLLE